MVEMITYDPEIFNETWNKISNVTEKRMKQYKLNTHLISGYRKDEEIPKEVKDDLISEGCPESWFSPVEEEFQEGDWVYYYGTDEYGPVRIEKIENEKVYHSGNDAGYWRDQDSLDWLNISNITRKATKDEIETALIAEAKRRGLWDNTPIKAHADDGCHDHFGNYRPGYNYEHDRLWSKQGVIYSKGKWASIVDEPIQINGYEVDTTIRLNNAGESVINIGCSHPPVYLIENLNQAIDDYDISIYREGENITKQIKQIADKL